MMPTGENPNPPNPEIERIITELQRMNAEEVVNEITNAHDEADNLKNQVDNKDSVLRMEKNSLPEAIVKDEATMDSIKNITVIVKRTVFSIKEGTGLNLRGDILNQIPEQSKEILIRLCENLNIENINEKSALYLNEIIYRCLNGQLETIDNIISLFENVKNLEYINWNLYKDISRVFQEQAVKLGASDEKLDRLTNKKIKESDKLTFEKKRKDIEYEQLKKDSQDINGLIKASINRLNVNDVTNSNLVKVYIEKYGLSPGQPDYDKNLKQVCIYALDDIKTRLVHDIDSISAVPIFEITPNMTTGEYNLARLDSQSKSPFLSAQNINSNYQRFREGLDYYMGEGIITGGIYQTLLEQAGKYMNNAVSLLGYRDQLLKEGGGLFGLADYYIKNWRGDEKGQKGLLKVLDDPKKFIEYIKENYDNLKEKGGGWERFKSDIRGLYDTIFSAASSNPKDFWQVSFNELTEGIVYKQLNSALFELANNLNLDEKFGKNGDIRVKTNQIYAQAEDLPYAKGYLSGGASLSQKKELKVTVGDGISILTHQMIDYKDLRELSHDINALTELGGGIEKLAEITARVRMEDLSRMIEGMPGLSTAIQYYCENLHKVTAINNRMFPVDFGRRDGVFSLDPTGQDTFEQLKATYKIRKLGEDFGWNDNDYARLVTTAQAYAKIVGAFFSEGLNNRLGIDVTWGKKDEYGRIIGQLGHTYKSISDSGIEKTATSLDPSLMWNKFNNPRIFKEALYSWAPRFIKGFEPEWEDKLLNHQDIYHWYEEGESAFVNGQKNDLIHFQKRHKFLYENLKTASIDIGLREAWRYYVYRYFVVYQKNPDGTYFVDKNGMKKIDFHKTLMRTNGLGSQITKIFINDIFTEANKPTTDVSDISLESLSVYIFSEFENELEGEFHGKKLGDIEWEDESKTAFKKGFKLSEDQKDALKLLLYKKYIFDHIRDVRPSHFIVMENRSWMPEDEVIGTPDLKKKGFTFHDSLLEYLFDTYSDVYKDKIQPELLRGWIKTNLLPMYIDAIMVTEKNEWNKHYDKWLENEDRYSFDVGSDPFNYKFKEQNAFDDEFNKQLLEEFYENKKNRFGMIHIQGKDIVFRDDDFIKHLKGFYNKIEEVIEMKRWNYNMEKVGGVWKQKDEKNVITLSDRYADMLFDGRGNIDSYLTYGDLNFDEFHFETSGNRMIERMFGESALVAKESVPAVINVFTLAMDKFARHPVQNLEEFEKLVMECFADSFTKINAAITVIDQNQAWEYLSQIMYSIYTMAAKDKVFRVGVFGPIMEGALMRWSGYNTQASYLTDHVKVTAEQGALAMDSTQSMKFFEILGNIIGMEREAEQIETIEAPKLFGKELKGNWAKIFPGKRKTRSKKDRHIAISDLIEGADVQIKSRLIEQAPMIIPIFLILMGLLLKLALDKDKKK